METTVQAETGVRRVNRRKAIEPVADETPKSPQQAYALRIWEGQSPDVGVIDRVARIANALKAQGMPLDVELPHPDAKRYLNAHR